MSETTMRRSHFVFGALALLALGCESPGGDGPATPAPSADPEPAATPEDGGDGGTGDAAPDGGAPEPAPDGGAPEPSPDGGAPEPADAAAPDPPPDADAEPDPAPEPAEPNGEPCPLATKVGVFEVGELEFYSAVTGTVQDGVIPLQVLQPVTTSGDCELLRKEIPFCDPVCEGGDLCDHEGKCHPHPKNTAVGKVTVSGLASGTVELEPNFANYYQAANVPFPLFEGGAAIHLDAAGQGGVPAFALDGVGVPDLLLPDVVVEMEKGQDLVLAWEPEDAGAAWEIAFRINVDQHGNSPVTLFCETEDDGSLVVPAALVTEMLGFGISGFATMDAYRRTVDSAAVPAGCVEMTVFSFAAGKLAVVGHTPCTNDLQCPDGQTCQEEIETCVDE